MVGIPVSVVVVVDTLYSHVGTYGVPAGVYLPASTLRVAVGVEVYFVFVPPVLADGDMSYLRYALHREVK